MRITLEAFLALALAASAALAHADPPGRVGRLNYASGAVSFATADTPGQWMQAVLNRPLTGGDRLWTDRDARSELHVGSTAVRMAAQTSVDVLHLDDDRVQLRLPQGTLNVRVRELDHNDVVEIATPGGAVLLREPGSYRIGVDPRTNTTRVAVSFGRAEVATPAQTLTVPSGQAAVVPDGAPAAFELAGYAADDFDGWSAERDRREDRVESTRYVSRDMTGYEDLDQHGTWRTLPEYGAVWVPARVAPGWAPYRHGHWTWISPWGWTWVDDAPWGFAPFHYGRWVHVHDYWAWAPGPIARRPVYAPALVAFVGGSRWSVSAGSGPAVGWFPLGWREPYHPWYRASPTYVRNVNVTHVTNVTHIHNHVHRRRPEAVTVIPQQSFVSARPVARSRVSVGSAELARAEVIRERAPAEPTRASFAPERPGQRPPAHAAAPLVIPAAPAAAPTREPARTLAAPVRAPDRRDRVEQPERHAAPHRPADPQRAVEPQRPAEPQRARPEPPRRPEAHQRGELQRAERREARQEHRERAEQRPRAEVPAARSAAPAPAAAAPAAAAAALRPQTHVPRSDGASRAGRPPRENARRPPGP